MEKIITLFNLLPKIHRAMLGLLLLAICTVALIPSDNAEASRQTHLQHIQETGLSVKTEQQKTNTKNDTKQESTNENYIVRPLAFRTPSAPVSDNTTSTRIWQAPTKQKSILNNEQTGNKTPDLPSLSLIEESYKVKPGDTLAAIFQQAGFSASDVYQVSLLKTAGEAVQTLMPGDTIVLLENEQQKFAGLRLALSPIEILIVNQTESGLTEHIETKSVEQRQKFVSASISSNFWNAALKAGLSPSQIMQLATIFGWDVDFALDLREGDSFALIYNDEYADGEFLQNGDILAAEFINQGERFTAIRYKDDQYYSEDGHSMRKAFLKSPVDFKYVSSNFNPRRLHPVTGQVKAHRGVDYVAAIGTPIKAAGNGRVIASSYNKYNGNYVFIKHNDTYTTKYLHLTKRKVKKGQYVKQGQIIGTLGKTGRVTGAHLHYEFIVNGVHRNPRTVKLPKAGPIATKARKDFDKLSETLMTQLQTYKKMQYAHQETPK